MTTVKILGSFAKVTAVLISAVLLLTGCSSEAEELPFIALGEEAERVSEYRVIISRGSSGEIIEGADALSSRIKEQTGVETLMFYDDEALIYRENTHEIIIGETSRTVSRVLLRGMRRDDYICAVDGARTVIGGRTDSATLAAIERFYTEILPISSSERLVPEGGGFSYKAEYPVERLSLFGVELSEYTVEVTNASDTYAVSLAQILKREIAEKTGYVLDVTVGNAAGRRIRLSSDSSQRSETAYIEKDEMGAVITADRDVGLKYAVEYLLDALEGAEDVALPNRVSIPYGDASLRIGSADLSELLPFGSGQSVTAAAGVITGADYEIMLCAPMNADDLARLQNAVTGETVIQGEGAIAFLAQGQPASFSSAGSLVDENGYRVEKFKIETSRLKLLLFYVCGSGDAERVIELSSEEGYIPVALVHTSGEADVKVTDGDGRFLSPTAAIDRLVCYTDEALVDVRVTSDGEFSPIYGEFEFLAR